MSQTSRGLESLLRDAGSRWRAAQPAPPKPDLAGLVRGGPPDAGTHRSRTTRRWVPVAAVAGVAAAIAVTVVPLAMSRGQVPPPATPGAFAVLPPDPGTGVPVVGTGTLFRDGQAGIQLCADVWATWDLPSSRAGCGPVAVPTTGVDAAWLTNTTTGGQAYSQRVRVEGTYHAGVLAVDRVVVASSPPAPAFVEPAVPCPAPRGGWRPWGGFATSEEEAAPMGRLTEHVQAGRDRYTELWEGHPGTNPPGASAPAVKVMVVGTTGDLARARAELTALYPGNLCVHRARHSAADLQRIAERLSRSATTPVGAVALAVENKVRVKVVALDAATVARLDEVGRDALLLEEPLLRSAG